MLRHIAHTTLGTMNGCAAWQEVDEIRAETVAAARAEQPAKGSPVLEISGLHQA